MFINTDGRELLRLILFQEWPFKLIVTKGEGILINVPGVVFHSLRYIQDKN